MDKAIVIGKVANHSAGVQAEYDYIIKKHGQPRVDWTMREQALMQDKGHAYDRLEIILKDGSPKTYYFDITQFFGQFEDELIQKPQASLIQ